MVRGSYVVYYPRSLVHQQPSRDCPRTPAGAARGTSVASGSPATTPGHSRNHKPIPACPRDSGCHQWSPDTGGEASGGSHAEVGASRDFQGKAQMDFRAA